MLNKDDLIQGAVDKTGLQAFGGPEFQPALARLIDALNSEARLNDFGQFRAKMSIEAGLTDNLQIQDYILRHPEVCDEAVVRPVFIVGLPRTGTTALHHMLNQDLDNHTLRLWEAQNPVPPPRTETYTSDPRIERQQSGVDLTEQFLPGFLKTHLIDAQEPDECYMLLNRCFMSVEYSAMYHIPSYANWLYQQLPHSNVYAYHRQQLQLLQSHRPGQWILKAPFHQLGLEGILQQYPDAVIVQTHRAPLSIVGSGCSFSEILRNSGSDHSDRKQVGRDWMEMLTVYTQTFEAARARLEPGRGHQFIDVYHDEFVNDPWPVIDAIYRACDRQLSEPGRAAMQTWLANNPKGKHGKHEYELADYGISEADVERLFGDYVTLYNLTPGDQQ